MNEYKIPPGMSFGKYIQSTSTVDEPVVRRPYISLRYVSLRKITPEIGEILFESPQIAYDFLRPTENIKKTIK